MIPIRQMRPRADLLLGGLLLDLERRRAQVDTGEELVWIGYDDLVIAVGSVAHASDSRPRRARARFATWRTRSSSATTCCGASRRRRRPRPSRTAGESFTFVFVGAGYAGVEALAELADLVRDALRYYPAPATSRSAGSSPTPRRRSSWRSRPALAITRPGFLGRRGIEIRTRTTLRGGRAARGGALRR